MPLCCFSVAGIRPSPSVPYFDGFPRPLFQRRQMTQHGKRLHPPQCHRRLASVPLRLVYPVSAGDTMVCINMPMEMARMRRWMRLMEAATFRAYHGSPHDFDTFDAAKIGSGEGSQQFGYGLYFAGDKRTARSYKAMAANPARRAQTGLTRTGQDQIVLDSLIRLCAHKWTHGDVNKLADLISKRPAAFEKPEAMLQRIALYHDNLPPSYMYEVQIDANLDHFLDWDRSVGQQNSLVQNFLSHHMTHGITPQSSGAEAYRLIGRGPEVSAIMLDAGIPGITHRDVGSLYGEDRKNYVVFDPATVKIVSKTMDNE